MIKQQILYNILISVLGVILGLLFCFTDPNRFIRIIFAGFGIFIIINALPGLFALNYAISEKEKTTSIIISIIMIVVGMFLIIYPHTIAYIISGCFLIVLPLYRILTSKNHMETFKKELVKLIAGVLLIICGIGTITSIILYILGGTIIVLSVIYMIYNIVLYIQINKKNKKDKIDNDVIDV